MYSIFRQILTIFNQYLDTSEATTTLLFEELKKNSEIKGQSVNQFAQHPNSQISIQPNILIDDDTSLVNSY